MNDHRMDKLMTGLREDYNKPPEIPREEMWAVIQSRLGASGSPEGTQTGEAGPGVDRTVVSLAEARQSRLARMKKPLVWAASAAAILVLGLGIGRWTAPVGPGVGQIGELASAETMTSNPAVLRAASVAHLMRTESLLTLVRSDARAGRMEAAVGSWARGLLTQTRLLMDAPDQADPVMTELLEDLELVLVQILGAANAPPGDEAQVRSELNLALDGIEEHEVLPRIQAVLPAGSRFVGT